MSLLPWVLLVVLVVAILGAGVWGYRYYRYQYQPSAESLPEADTGTGEHSLAPAGDDAGMAGEPSGSAAAGDDPVAAFGLDPEQWAPLSQRSQRVGYARGLLRGASKPARLAGEPDAILEHRDGDIVVVLNAGRAYEGHPRWGEVSALTLQMGIARMRWPKCDVSGLVRYTDCAVPVPYKADLFKDLRRAARSHKDQELPDATELAGAQETATAPSQAEPSDETAETGASRSPIANLWHRLRGARART
jgi:hypothetical protein